MKSLNDYAMEKNLTANSAAPTLEKDIAMIHSQILTCISIAAEIQAKLFGTHPSPELIKDNQATPIVNCICNDLANCGRNTEKLNEYLNRIRDYVAG